MILMYKLFSSTKHSKQAWDFLQHSNVCTIYSLTLFSLTNVSLFSTRPQIAQVCPTRHPSAFNWRGAATYHCTETSAVATENTLALALLQTSPNIITSNLKLLPLGAASQHTHTYTHSTHIYTKNASTHLKLVAPTPLYTQSRNQAECNAAPEVGCLAIRRG